MSVYCCISRISQSSISLYCCSAAAFCSCDSSSPTLTLLSVLNLLPYPYTLDLRRNFDSVSIGLFLFVCVYVSLSLCICVFVCVCVKSIWVCMCQDRMADKRNNKTVHMTRGADEQQYVTSDAVSDMWSNNISHVQQKYLTCAARISHMCSKNI